jgi:hypothetical protein
MRNFMHRVRDLMYRILRYLLWAVGILLFFGMATESHGWHNFVPGLLAYFNFDPSVGALDRPYTQQYLEAWAYSKVAP